MGLNGLYDLPTLIRESGEKHAHLLTEYEAFTRAAFGEDEIIWQHVSPISIKDWAQEWGRSDGTVVLVQSQEDSLVPYWQLVKQLKAHESSKLAGMKVFQLPATANITNCGKPAFVWLKSLLKL